MAKILLFLTTSALSFLNKVRNWQARRILQKRIRACSIKSSYRVVVYTAIFGSKDKLKEVRRYPGIDYVCFTDDENLKSRSWTIKKIDAPSIDPRKNAKIYKILPHRFFSNYEYSLWIDGTHIPTIDIRFLVHKFLVKDDIALFSHPARRCIYEEMQACVKCNKDDAEIIKKQEAKYQRENYPEMNGLAACTVILRRHNAPQIKKTMEDWWREIEQYSIRDQLSFNYVAHRNNLKYAVLPGDVYDNYFFTCTEHRLPDSAALSVGWLLNGTPETASARIMGYNVHDYLISKNVSSIILHQPESRFVFNLTLSKRKIYDILFTEMSVLVFVKIDSEEGVEYLIERCKKKNIKIVYAIGDVPSKRMLKMADAIIIASDYIAKIVPKRYRRKIFVAFDGYEQPEGLHKIHSKDRNIKLCFVSNLVWDKFPCIHELPKDVRLKIVGPKQEILESSFKNSAVFKKSGFDFEYVPWDIRTVYQEILECDIGIIPWAKIGLDQKVKSVNRLVMFMALGLPVIASPIPSYLKIIRHGENGFIAKTSSEWMDYIIFLRDNPEKRKEIGENARADVLHRFSKEKQGEVYLNIFEQVRAKPTQR